MNDRDHARHLLRLAHSDLRALTGMEDAETFTDAIFGFHAQQTLEKGLKAWLSWLNIPYPKTHDLRLLLALVDDNGHDVSGLWDIVEFNVYAVQFRYDWMPGDDSFSDRKSVIRRTGEVLEWLERRIKDPC